jgi:lipocalin
MFYYNIHVPHNHVMTHFNGLKYSGIWYEVSSKKTNPYDIAAKCRNTKTLLQYDKSNNKIHSQTACGDYQGNMNVFLESEIVCKDNKTICKISYPSDPFIPELTFRIIDTDYSSYSFVSTGANINKESQNWQIYSRIPYPGSEWIQNKKNLLLHISTLNKKDIDEFIDTPQDLVYVPFVP